MPCIRPVTPLRSRGNAAYPWFRRSGGRTRSIRMLPFGAAAAQFHYPLNFFQNNQLRMNSKTILWRRDAKSIVPKSCRLGAAKHTHQDYIKLHGSREKMKPKLTDKSTRYATRQLTRGKTTKTASEELGVARRHIQRLWAEYKNTGAAPPARKARTPNEAPVERGGESGAGCTQHRSGRCATNHKKSGQPYKPSTRISHNEVQWFSRSISCKGEEEKVGRMRAHLLECHVAH